MQMEKNQPKSCHKESFQFVSNCVPRTLVVKEPSTGSKFSLMQSFCTNKKKLNTMRECCKQLRGMAKELNDV